VATPGAESAVYDCVVDTEWHVATVVMLLTGKAFITMAYNIAYLYGSEIFPTEVRSVGIGVAAVMEDVGAFVAPLIAGPLVLVYIARGGTNHNHW